MSQKQRKKLPSLYCVYFIQCGVNGPVKVGRSKNVRKRMGDMQIAVPYTLHYRIGLGVVEYELSKRIEKLIHEQFWSLNIRGEWFKPEILSEASKAFRRSTYRDILPPWDGSRHQPQESRARVLPWYLVYAPLPEVDSQHGLLLRLCAQRDSNEVSA